MASAACNHGKNEPAAHAGRQPRPGRPDKRHGANIVSHPGRNLPFSSAWTGSATPLKPAGMSLERFKTAQASSSSGHATALRELAAGRKTGHWIWYIFPQLAGLGRSPTARTYGLNGLTEALAYLRDPLLCARLCEAARVVAGHARAGADLTALMGGEIDALKLVSSLTLFEQALEQLPPPELSVEQRELHACAKIVLDHAATQGFPRCRQTLREIGAEPPRPV
jgi:uncharacterized protein (DUF1810 family)